MTRVLVTGAAGLVGNALIQRLLAHGFKGRAVRQVIASDLAFEQPSRDVRVWRVEGSIVNPAVRQRALALPPDVVFHLDSVPGGVAERNYELSRSINLDATVALLEDLRSGATRPHFVFASTVAVYGDAHCIAAPSSLTLPVPTLTFGAHKLAAEIMVANASRLCWVQGCSLRLPGVVSSADNSPGKMAAFMSRLFSCLARGEALTVPVKPEVKAWWISVGACVDNLLHAASLPPEHLDARCCCQMPALWLSVGEVVQALAERLGPSTLGLVSYVPDSRIEKLFTTHPSFSTAEAEALGFVHDGSAESLVARALA